MITIFIKPIIRLFAVSLIQAFSHNQACEMFALPQTTIIKFSYESDQSEEPYQLTIYLKKNRDKWNTVAIMSVEYKYAKESS